MSKFLDGTGLAELCNHIKTYIPNQLASYAPKNSPALTGTPTAPTPTAGDNSTKLATTAFVQGELPNPVFVGLDSGGSNIPISVNLPSHGMYYLIICTASGSDSSNTQAGIGLVDTTIALCFRASGINGSLSVSGTTVSGQLSNMSGKTVYVYYMRIGDGANPS